MDLSYPYKPIPDAPFQGCLSSAAADAFCRPVQAQSLSRFVMPNPGHWTDLWEEWSLIWSLVAPL